jgi:hypothetical protein
MPSLLSLEMRELVTQVPAAQWQQYVIKEGGHGPLVADFAFCA